MKRFLLILTMLTLCLGSVWAQNVKADELTSGWYQVKVGETNNYITTMDTEHKDGYPAKSAALDENNIGSTMLYFKVGNNAIGNASNVSGKWITVRDSKGKYMKRNAKSSIQEPEDKICCIFSTSSDKTKLVFTNATNTVDNKNRYSWQAYENYIGLSAASTFNIFYAQQASDTYTSNAYTVNVIVDADGSETVTYNGTETHYGFSTVYNNGTFFFEQGVTPSANDFTFDKGTNTNYSDNPGILIDTEDKTITVLPYTNRDIDVPDGFNGYIGGITTIGEAEWKTKEYWTLQDTWNAAGPGCSPNAGEGMWSDIYLKDIVGGTVPALDGWNFRMTADHSTYTIASVGKIQCGNDINSYLTLQNSSTVTMNFGSGTASPFIVNLNEGTGNILDFAMSSGFGSQITVNYGNVADEMNRQFNGSGSGTINTLILNATIAGSNKSATNTLHSVVLGNINSNITVTTLTYNITAENFIRTTSEITADKTDVGKYSVVKNNNGDITLCWVTGPEVDMSILDNAFAGTTDINSGILTVNPHSSTIAKNTSGDIVLYNENDFNNILTGGAHEASISFRITLNTPTEFTRIFTYSPNDEWDTGGNGNIGIGLSNELKLEGLWQGSEYNSLKSDALDAGEHILTVVLGESANSYGTRIYVDGNSTYYSSSALKTSYKNYKYILINSTITSNINALYAYKGVLTSAEIEKVFLSIKNMPVVPFPDNTKLYVIKGHNEYNSPDVYYDGSYDYVRIGTTSGDTDNYKWAIYTKNNKTFMYNFGAKKFVCQLSGICKDSWLLKDDEANEMIITKQTNDNAFDYFTFRSKYCKGDNEFMHYQTSGYNYGSTNWSDDVDDSKWRIAEVCELTQAQQDAIAQAFEEHAHLSQTEVDVAKANIITGVGYPKISTDTYKALNDLSTSTMAYNVDIDDIVSNYKEEQDVELPKDGKAYYIINGQYSSAGEMEANKYVLYNNSNNMAVKAYSAESLDESCIWVVRKIEDGYYALVSATGSGGYCYLHWTNNESSKQMLTTTYSEADAYTKTKMHIAKIVHDSNVVPTNVQLFGYLSLRGYRKSDDGTDAPIIFAGAEAKFDATTVDIVRYMNGNTTSQYSTAVQFVEVTGYTANQVSLKAPKVTDGKTYASICLPYPVKVPDDVTAYYCTLSGTALHMNDIGDKIPASTGSILVGGSVTSTQTLLPAASERTDENVGTNVLGGVVSDTSTSTLGNPVYVLNGGQKAGIGFYPYSQTATLGAYKAYYAPQQGAPQQGSRDFYPFGFDDSATGIEGLLENVDNLNETVANGRKVLLQDGKIVIMKDGKRYNVAGRMYK